MDLGVLPILSRTLWWRVTDERVWLGPVGLVSVDLWGAVRGVDAASDHG